MILNSSVVEQIIDGDTYGRFIKEIVVARPPGGDPGGGVPLAMVRKRLAPPSAQRSKPGGDHGMWDDPWVEFEPPKAAILLIHGYGQNHYAWHLPARSLVNYLAADGFDVFNLDLRGHGRSRHLGARPPQKISEYVREDVPAAINEIRKHTQAQWIFLMGHSLGGLICYAAAPALQDCVAGVVSLGSPYHFTRGSKFLSVVGNTLLTLDRTLSFGHGLVPLKHLAETMRLARVFIESPLFPLPIRGYAPGQIEPRVLGQHMSLAMDRGSVAVIRNLFLRAAESRARGHRLGVLYGHASAFERLDMPLLVIAGSRDGLAPPEAVRPAYVRSNSSDKTYRVFPNGHIDILVGRDAPQTIWPLILAWLNSRLRRRLQRAA